VAFESERFSAARLAAALLVMTLVAAACGDDGRNVGAAATLRGRTFLSDSVTVSGDPRPLVTGTQIRLTFYADGRITATAGCNMLSGTFRVDRDHLVISELGSTEMGCDAARHSQDEWLASVLTANPTYALADARLQVRSEDTVLALLDREVADPDRPLLHTVWAVDGVIDGSMAGSIPSGTSATMVLDDDKIDVTITSCNQISGSVKIAPTTIEVGHLVTTDVACTGAAAALETAIVAVLDGKITYAIEATTLRLTRSNGKGLTLREQ
jgi:heat shock protein HslJ